MTHRISRRRFAGGVVATSWVLGTSRRALAGEEPFRLRCSLDTAPSHLRNVSISDYLKKLESAANGRISTQLFHSGQLFPDLQVGKALLEGQIEMAAPGHWTMTGLIPDADFFQLPVLYGRPLEVVHKAMEGGAGQLVAAQIEHRLRARVLGPWLDLGFQNWYSTNKPLTAFDDLKGLKIRNPGGAGNAWRTRFMGAIPNTTAWPQVPLALSQGTFDALISTNESLASAKLWEAGIRFAIEDHQFVGEYIPMVSLGFWNKLPADLQELMTTLWKENIATYRANMAAAQTQARKTLEEHGVKFFDPSPQQIADLRKRMMAEQDRLAKDIKMSPDLVKMVMADVGDAS
jgi:TRAP-type C4-dicarboxylate transport system substrate-binding protein